MSLKSRFKTSSALVQEGVWFDVVTNSDGSKCRVKLRRHGRSNKLWVAAFREHTKDRDMENISIEEDEVVTAEVFIEANLVDWENLQPEDDGVNLEFSVSNAQAILLDPDWNDMLKDWQAKSNTLTAFQEKSEARREGEAGN